MFVYAVAGACLPVLRHSPVTKTARSNLVLNSGERPPKTLAFLSCRVSVFPSVTLSWPHHTQKSILCSFYNLMHGYFHIMLFKKQEKRNLKPQK